MLAVAVDEGDVAPAPGEEVVEAVAKRPPFTTIRLAAENFRSGLAGDLGRPVFAPVVDDEDVRNVSEETRDHVTDPRFAPKRGDEGGGPKEAFCS